MQVVEASLQRTALAWDDKDMAIRKQFEHEDSFLTSK